MSTFHATTKNLEAMENAYSTIHSTIKQLRRLESRLKKAREAADVDRAALPTLTESFALNSTANALSDLTDTLFHLLGYLPTFRR
jgi:hypothetical protein